MNKDLETVVERTNAGFEKTVREQTPGIATICFLRHRSHNRGLRNRRALQVKAGVREEALQKQERRTNNIESTGRPAAAKGGSVPPLR
jgi:hypothetical protein